MIECLRVEAACRPEGVVLEVGGLQAETPEAICGYLGEALGRHVPYVELSYEAFGEAICDDLFRLPDGSKGNPGIPKERLIQSLSTEYKHWNDHPSEPMNID